MPTRAPCSPLSVTGVEGPGRRMAVRNTTCPFLGPKSVARMEALVEDEGRSRRINNIVAKETVKRPFPSLGALRTAPVAQRLEHVDAVVVDGVLTSSECSLLVSHTEAIEEGMAGYSFWAGRRSPEAAYDGARCFRSADTLEAEQPHLCEDLWARLAPFVPSRVDMARDDPLFEKDLEGVWEPVGLNTHLLFARYGEGGHFAPHVDGVTELDFDTRSLYSAIVYLNTCSAGGATRLLRGEQHEATTVMDDGRLSAAAPAVLQRVDPRAGRVLVFYHGVLHDGEPVGAGQAKYIIRTDVVYRRREPLCTAPMDLAGYALYCRARDREAAGACAEAAGLFRRAFKTSPLMAQMFG